MGDVVVLNGVDVPAGASAAVDDCGADGVVQILKLAIATDGSATLIPATAAAGLAVNPTDSIDRDNGKIDVATLDEYTPFDVDTVGTSRALPVVLKVEGAGGITITGDAANGLDVDVTRVIPGTDATHLGKAIGSAVGATDTGVLILGKYNQEASTIGVDIGDYAPISLTPLSEVRTRDQRSMDFQNCNTAADWTVLGNDTANIADSVKHVFGTGAISFDKVNGADNTVYACIQDTITSINVEELFEAGGFVGQSMYIPTLTNVVAAFLRLGTDSGNYQQWTWPVAGLSAATWMNLRTPACVPDYANSAGNGWNPAAVTYVATGIQFASETNTLAGILVDHIHAVGGRVTSTDVTTGITTTVNTANVNINRIAGASTAVSGGTEATSLRVTIANDSTGLLSVDDNGGSLTVDVGTALPAGTNAIGKLSANSGVDIGDVDVTSISAGTNTIGGVIGQQSSSILYDGTTACTVYRYSVANPADGATLVSGVADKKIRVLAFAIFTESATVTNFWLEDADGADVFGDSTGIPLITTGATGAGGLVLQYNPCGWFQTATANKHLVIQLTAAQPVVVCLNYILVA